MLVAAHKNLQLMHTKTDGHQPPTCSSRAVRNHNLMSQSSAVLREIKCNEADKKLAVILNITLISLEYQVERSDTLFCVVNK